LVVQTVGLPNPDAHAILPICALCKVQSAIFSVVEYYERGSRACVLCRHCFRNRSLAWERFAVHVQVTRLDQDQKSN